MDSHHRLPRAFPWRSATELRHLNIYQLRTMGYFKAPDTHVQSNKNTITSLPGELTRTHFKLKLYTQFSFFVDLRRVGRSCLRMMPLRCSTVELQIRIVQPIFTDELQQLCKNINKISIETRYEPVFTDRCHTELKNSVEASLCL